MTLGKKLDEIKIFVLTVTMMLAMSAMALAAVPTVEDYPEDDGFVYAVGIGEANQSFTSGIRAAELSAYRKCIERLDAELEYDSEYDAGYVNHDVIKARLQRLVHGLHILKENRDSETGLYYAVVKMPLHGATKSLAKAVFDPAKANQAAFAEPQAKVVDVSNKNTSAQPNKQTMDTVLREGNYTGVIIDCRGMGLKSTMSPVIKNARGESIYGYKNLNYDKVVAIGMAGYTSSLNQNVSRAGSHPLVLKAIRVEKRASQNHVDPVLSNADADKLLAENASTGFLNNCAVVFVR